MSFETVRKAAEFLKASGQVAKDLTILWHAGEPLVLGCEYYEKAIAILNDVLGDVTRITYSIQTNGIGLTDEWCVFIKKHRFSIGLSIDGPEHVHDAYRKTKAGKGTHRITMSGLARLKSWEIPFSIICVITSYSLKYPLEIATYLSTLGARSIGFNIEELEGYNKNSTLIDRGSAANAPDEAVKGFIETVYELWDSQGKAYLCREFKRSLRSIASIGKDPRRGVNTALSILTVTANGRISTFSPELCGFESDGLKDFTFGTIENTLQEIVESPLFIKVSTEIEKGVERCMRECGYYSICGGGSPSNKFSENGTFNSTHTKFCTYHVKYFADVVISNLSATDAT